MYISAKFCPLLLMHSKVLGQ